MLSACTPPGNVSSVVCLQPRGRDADKRSGVLLRTPFLANVLKQVRPVARWPNVRVGDAPVSCAQERCGRQPGLLGAAAAPARCAHLVRGRAAVLLDGAHHRARPRRRAAHRGAAPGRRGRDDAGLCRHGRQGRAPARDRGAAVQARAPAAAAPLAPQPRSRAGRYVTGCWPVLRKVKCLSCLSGSETALACVPHAVGLALLLGCFARMGRALSRKQGPLTESRAPAAPGGRAVTRRGPGRAGGRRRRWRSGRRWRTRRPRRPPCCSRPPSAPGPASPARRRRRPARRTGRRQRLTSAAARLAGTARQSIRGMTRRLRTRRRAPRWLRRRAVLPRPWWRPKSRRRRRSAAYG